MRMIEQATFERPRLAGISRFEESRRLDAAVKRVAVVRIVDDLPNLFERDV